MEVRKMSKVNKFESRIVLGKEFDIYGTSEDMLFLAKDVAEWIDYSKDSLNKMLTNVDEDEKVRNTVPTLGGNQQMWFLTEDGLYEVLMQSRKPIAKQFKKEIKVILKELRQKGVYVSEEATDSQKAYNYNMLDVTFSRIGAEFMQDEYRNCIVFHEAEKTRLPFEKKNKNRRSDKKRTVAESKIKVMEKILKIAESREQQYRVNFQWELKSLISEVVKVIQMDIKTIKHNQTRGKLSKAKKVI
ncbi:BRO-N domain-containing protein [Sutcliffiella horikoshii]